jgi:hypothetical protein
MSGSGGFSFFVVDKTGTNVLLNVSSVLVITAHQTVKSGAETFISTTTGGATHFSGNDTEAYTEYVTLTCNDASLTTADASHSNFQFSGILKEMYSCNNATGKVTGTVTLPGAGGGTLRDKTCVLTGTVSGVLSKPMLF